MQVLTTAPHCVRTRFSDYILRTIQLSYPKRIMHLHLLRIYPDFKSDQENFTFRIIAEIQIQN